MTRVLLAVLILTLLAATTATAHTVDGGWHRSDDAPEPTPTAPPETATEPEAAAWTWSDYAMAGVGGLLVLAALWGAVLWLRGDAR